MTTLDEIRAGAASMPFPAARLHKGDTAACFFAAAFLGKNDVIHLLDAGADFVTLVDSDEARLEEMSRLYPERWGINIGDAYEWAEIMRKDHIVRDVVTVDPWSGGPQYDALLHLPLWLSIAKRLLIIGISADFFDGMQLPCSVEGLNAWIDRSHWAPDESPTHAVDLIRRSSFQHGQFWAVFEKEPS